MSAASGSRPDFRLGDWLVRPSLATIERDTDAVHITPRSMAVLLYLADAGGAVVSRNELLDAVWPGMSVTPDALSQCLVELRKAFHDDPRQPAVIQTIPKLGLRLLLPVGPVEPAGSRPRRRWLIPVSIAVATVAGAALLWFAMPRRDWRDPLVGADFTPVTDFIGSEEHGAISPDGRFIAFVSDRDGAWDIFVGPTGTGDFQNLTQGRIADLRNPAVRMLNFSPNGADVLIWSAKNQGWSIPVVGGDLRSAPAGVAEIDWSPDRRRVVYHPAAPGDPLLVASADEIARGERIYAAPSGIHCHFPLWSRDGRTIYFVQGFVPDEMDLWQIAASGGEPQRLTWHNARVSFPALLDQRTLLYLATTPDGSGPWIHAFDLEKRVTHRLKSASNAYTSLAVSADGRRLIVTAPHPTASLWSVRFTDGVAGPDAVTQIPIHTQRGVAPRLGPGSLIYRAPKAGTDALWRHEGSAAARELWSGRDGRVIAGPALSADGQRVAFTVRSRGRSWLYVMSSDGSGAHKLAQQLDVRGAPAWSPDGKWIAIAALQGTQPHLFKIPASDGPAVALTDHYALDPVWSPSGSFLMYTGADVGTVFEVRAIGAGGEPHAIPKLSLTRGSRRLEFLGADEATLVVLEGAQARKEFWAVDLRSGARRALTDLGPGPVIGDFDVAADGQSIVFDRSHEESDLTLIELAADPD
jgi:Tol biopolymer transport system component/DNA-binding winged helix-turn-helix (wHTH) protein